APGVDGTDAVNVSQLNQQDSDLTTKGLDFAGDSGTDVHRDLGQTLNVTGGADASGNTNITTVADDANGELSIVMSDQPQFGNVTVNTGGDDTIDGLGNTTFDPDNVVDDRAATEGQLDEVNKVANAGWGVATSDTTATDTSNVAPEAEVDFVSDDASIMVEHTRDDATGNTSIDFALGSDLSVGGPGEDGADGQDGKIGVNGADGVSGVGIDGSDGSIGLTGPAGADGTSPELTMHPGIEPGDVAADDTDVTRLQYEDGDGNQKNIATLEDDGLRFSGNENPADGYVTRNLNKEMQIVGGAEDADTASYSSGNVNTVATQEGGIEIQFADTPSFQGADMGGEQVTSLAKGKVGENSTDAVNGSQLWKIKDIANAGWNVATSNTTGITTSNVAPEATVDFVGSDGNVVVEHTRDENTGNTSIDYTLNDSITLGDGNTAVTVDGKNGKVSVGDTIMDGEGLKIANGGPSVTVNGIDAGRMQITNVGSGLGGQKLDKISGDELMNAVNVGDLKQVAGDIGDDVAAAKTEVTEGNNISVTESTGGDGQTIYTVATDPEVEFDSIEISEGGPTINKDGIDMGENKITGLAPGEVTADSTDAVNGSQLHGVKEEIGDINSSLDGGMDFAADEGDDVNRELGDTVAITGDDNITTRTNDGGVEVGLNRDLDVDSVTTGKTTVSNEGVTIEDGPSMTTDGIDAGDMRITNVAPGVDATDAVNVGQMQELNQRFAQEINKVHGRIKDVEDNANAGTASALAAATVPQAWMPGKSMVGVGAGTYEGESAVSVGVSRLSDNGRWVIQGKVTGDSQSNFGAGVGAGWHW
ncbi:YadA-like family protein, partial [Halomonas halodenitrificans]|uniref:YadA-like family protein n=1 Tax=Halomonas halodenitrificans TaxID=28252 RepID=UPI000488EED5